MDFGGFPGGARGPSHSSHAELAQLRARLAQDERRFPRRAKNRAITRDVCEFMKRDSNTFWRFQIHIAREMTCFARQGPSKADSTELDRPSVLESNL